MVKGWISIFWNYDIQIQIENIHLNDHDMASSTVLMACLYVKGVILYDFFKRCIVLGRKMETHGVTKTTISKKN